MLDFQQKRKIRSLMYHRVTLGVLFVIVLISLHSTWSVYAKKQESEDLKMVSEQKVLELKARNNDLSEKIERLSTDTGIEEEIRSKFSVAKENEAMVIIVEDEESSTSTTQKRGFWQKFKEFWVKK